MKTVYLQIIDEELLAAHLPLKRSGTWEGELPESPIPDNVRTTLADGCSTVQAKGSLAGYAVLEGLREVTPLEDGDFIGGTECLPITAFHPRMYVAVIAKLAEALADYDRIIAHAFINGRPGRPLTNVGSFPVQCYDQMSWVAPGSVSEEWIVWEIEKPEAPPEEEPQAQKPVRRSRSKKKDEPVQAAGDSEDRSGDV